MPIRRPDPPLDYLHSASVSSLESYELSRLNHAANLRREIAALSAQSDSRHVSPVSFALIYAGLGDKEKALDYLDEAIEIRAASLPVQMLGPEFDGLRGESRFQALRQRMGLPEA